MPSGVSSLLRQQLRIRIQGLIKLSGIPGAWLGVSGLGFGCCVRVLRVYSAAEQDVSTAGQGSAKNISATDINMHARNITTAFQGQLHQSCIMLGRTSVCIESLRH